MMTTYLTRALVGVACSLSIGCADESPTAPTPTSSITIALTSGTMAGPTFQLSAAALQTDGSSRDVTALAAWVSSDPQVASVSAGAVTVLGTGEVEVRATYDGVVGARRFTVGREVVGLNITGATDAPRFQLTATANFSDSSSRNVTMEAEWHSSNSQVATVSSGLVMVVGPGEAEIRAVYQGTVGSQRLVIPSSTTFELSGTVEEVAPNARPVAGATVRVLSGLLAPATTDANGRFVFPRTPAQRVIVEVSKEGYEPLTRDVRLERDTRMTFAIYPTPPRDNEGERATARCRDNSWSWATTAEAACVNQGGVAYTVCPGALCQSSVRGVTTTGVTTAR